MAGKHKTIFINKLIVLLIFLLLVVVYVVHQWRTSIILNEKDRINIAVFCKIPFVYSFNPHNDLAVAAYFWPDNLVKVPGGYDWYRVGSLNLLGKIEKQETAILKSAFSELIGAPVDFVFYPKKAAVIGNPQITFDNFYHDFVKSKLFTKEFANSTTNLFDRILLKRLFQVSRSHLLFLNTDDLTIKKDNHLYYYSDKLDTKLKGMFYHESVINQAYKAVIVTNEEKYKQAEFLLRQLEGVGIKVVDIELAEKLKNKKCLIQGAENQKKVLQKLSRLFNCQTKMQKSQIIKFYIGGC